MTKLDALKGLAANIEAGKWWADAGIAKSACAKTGLPGQHCTRAFNGSLDAAKALHEAVLPGWEWGVTCNAEQPGGPAAFVADLGDYQNGFEATNENPARAWLLAILRALISQEESA